MWPVDGCGVYGGAYFGELSAPTTRFLAGRWRHLGKLVTTRFRNRRSAACYRYSAVLAPIRDAGAAPKTPHIIGDGVPRNDRCTLHGGSSAGPAR